MATDLVVIVNAVDLYDKTTLQFRVTSNSIDNDNQIDNDIYTYFTVGESPAVINARIIEDAKASHGRRYGSTFNALTPVALFSGSLI